MGWAVVRRAAAGRSTETTTQGRPGYMGTGRWTFPVLHPGSRLPRPTSVPPTRGVPCSWDGVEVLPNYSVFANIQFPQPGPQWRPSPQAMTGVRVLCEERGVRWDALSLGVCDSKLIRTCRQHPPVLDFEAWMKANTIWDSRAMAGLQHQASCAAF